MNDLPDHAMIWMDTIAAEQAWRILLVLFVPCEHGQALAQAARGSWGCPIPGSFQVQVGWAWSDLVYCIVSLPVARGMEIDILPNRTILWYIHDFGLPEPALLCRTGLRTAAEWPQLWQRWINNDNYKTLEGASALQQSRRIYNEVKKNPNNQKKPKKSLVGIKLH